jgi:regulatory protein
MALRRNRTILSPERRADPAAARAAAVALLARRDFAAQELLARLTDRGFDAGSAAVAIAELGAQGILNEARYAQNFVTWHAARGQGPLRIEAQLKQQGVAPELIDAALQGPHDWAALARKVRRGRFGPQPPPDWPEQARQARFLQYRGFSMEQIRAATGASVEAD